MIGHNRERNITLDIIISAVKVNRSIYLTIAIVILSLAFLNVHLTFAQGANEEYPTWIANSPDQQLYKEGLDDQKGMGRIFVPAMTNPANEPPYAVFKDDELVNEHPMGSSVFLPPGNYSVRLGTGSKEQKIERIVDLERGQTVIIEPTWSALTVDVIDETRNNASMDLQIYSNETFENFGIIPSINPELGEQLQTMLLKPGWYKIVPRGADPNTFVNFATVLLEEGTYTPFTIVISSQSNDFIGSGVLTSATRVVRSKNWKLYGAIHGSVVLNSQNNKSEEKTRTNLSLLTQVENRILYDTPKHYYLSHNLLELGALQPQEEDFEVSQDRIQLKNTYVYYFFPKLGSYIQFKLISHLFPTYSQKLSTNRDYIMREKNGIESRINDVRQVKIEPSFFPLGLEEGIGINFTALRSFSARLNLRTGFGYRQTYNHNVYKQASGTDTLVVYERIPSIFVRGYETSILSNLAIWQNLTIDTELAILFPIDNMKNPDYDLENTITLAATRNITLEHVFRLSRDPSFDWLVHEQFVTVRVSYFFF